MSNLIFDFCKTSRVIEEIPPDDPIVTSMNGWDFAAKPKTPFRRTFKITLNGMQWFLTTATRLLYAGEVVVNGSFSDSTQWNLTNYTISDGFLTSGLTTGNNAYQDTGTTTVVGDVYDICVVVKDAGSGTVGVSLGIAAANTAYMGTTTLTTGENKLTAVVNNSAGNLRITFTTSSTATKPTIIHSVSIRKRLGLATNYIPIDPLGYPTRNAGRLLEFYQAHRLWDSFIIWHEYLGSIRVRFNKPIRLPAGKPDSNGLCDPIEVELIEHSPSYT